MADHAPSALVDPSPSPWEHYRLIAESSSDVVCRTDGRGVVQWISPSATALLGAQPEELVGQVALDWLHPDDARRLSATSDGIDAGDGVDDLPARLRTASGRYRDVRALARPVVDGAGTVVGSLVTFRDVHEKVAAVRALATLSGGNRALVRSTEPDQLLRRMCEAVVTTGDFAFAWYGRPLDDLDKSVALVARAGDDQGYLDDIAVSWGVGPLGAGPVGTSIRTRQSQVRNNFLEDPGCAAWLPAAEGRGIRCAIALPVIVDDAVHGVLAVYAYETDRFDPTSQALLEDLAADLGFGLSRLADEHRLRATIDSFMDPHVLLRPVRRSDGRIIDFSFVDANNAACHVNGTPRHELLGRRLLDVFPGHHQSGLFDRLVTTIESGVALQLDDFPYDGDTRWGGGRYFDQRAVGVGADLSYTWRDVTAWNEASVSLHDSEKRFRMLAENAMDLVVSTDTDWVIDWVAPSITAVLGYQPSEVVGLHAESLVHPDDRRLLRETVNRSFGGSPDSARLRFRPYTGDFRWMELTPRPVHDHAGTLVGGVAGLRDVDREVRTTDALERELSFDALTGLAKRSVGIDRIRELLETRHAPGWALLCAGVHGLTTINQAYTYAAGDEVLVEVANRLVAAAGAHDRVARIAGDEFVVLLRDIVTAADAVSAAERLLDAVHGSVLIAGTQVDLDICIGIAVADGGDAESLVRDATAAMRQAAAKGPRCCVFLDGNVALQTRHVLDVQAELRAALADDQIVPWFQPVTVLADGRTVGYEALVRWIRPDGSVVPPADFLDIAERSNLILQIDQVVLAKSVQAIARLDPDLHVAVNVSAATLHAGHLEWSVRSALELAGVAPSRLHLEVTETALLHATGEVGRTMRALSELGITWWVDDFGTGYSSVSHLRDLPVHGLKLDRSFTADIASSDDHSARLALGLVGLAQGLGLDTVAEGVETREQAAALLGQGWHLGQGWLYGRPGPLPG